MNKMVLVAALATAVIAPAAIAGDKVKVEFNGNSERMDVGDLKTTSVCALKQRVAAKFDLKMKKFDLHKKHSTKLNGDKTLHGAGVNNQNTLTIKEVNHSYQC